MHVALDLLTTVNSDKIPLYVKWCSISLNLVPSPHAPPGEKLSQISWAYSPKVVRTNEVARSVIIT